MPEPLELLPPQYATAAASPLADERPAPRGRQPRVAWWHPALTDYRLPLFEQMAARCELHLVFMQPGVTPSATLAATDLHVSRRARRAVALRPDHLVVADLLALARRIRAADVFITSFSLNLYTVFGLAFARMLGIPTVIWEEMQRMPSRGLWAAPRRSLLRWVARRAGAYFVMGEPQRELLRRLGVPAQRIFESAEAPAERYAHVPAEPMALPFAAGRRCVLYLGRLIPIKGVDVLLHAFAQLKRHAGDAALAIAGSGPQAPALQELARSLGLRVATPCNGAGGDGDADVAFLGHVAARGHKAWLLQRAHVLAVPSVYLGDWGEGGPLVIPEALSAGTPVVCTDACGNTVNHVRRTGCGAVVAQGDAGALAEALDGALRRPPVRAVVCRAARGLPDHAHQADTLTAAIRHAMAASTPAAAAGRHDITAA